MKVLYLSDNFDYNCGVSKHIYYLLGALPANIDKLVIVPGGTALSLLDELNINYSVKKIFTYAGRTKIKFFSAIAYLLYIIIKERISIIHCHNYYSANITYAVKFLTGVKIVQTIHGDFKREGILKKFAADNYIFVSQYIYKKSLIEDKGLELSGKVILNGIPVPEQSSKITDLTHHIRILAAARLVESKGIQVIINALKILNTELKEKIIFTVLGKGPMAKKLKKEAKLTGLKILFPGEVSNISEYYYENDIFINSSFSESFGLTLIEAGGHNCFVITSDFDGVGTILRDNIEGFVYHKYSPEDLALKISKAVSPEMNRKQYIDSYYDRIKENFSANIMAAQTADFYNEVLLK